MTSLLRAILCLTCLFPVLSLAQAKAPWTVDDLINQEVVRGFTVSDDGRLALWMKSTPNKAKDKAIATLMLSDLKTGEHRALTVGQASIAAPAFVPGKSEISFLTSRAFPEGMKGPKKDEAGSQVWLLSLEGGEARPLTQIPLGVRAYQWHDAKTLFVSIRSPRSLREVEATESKDKSIVVEDPELFVDAGHHLCRFDVMTKKLHRIGESGLPMTSFRVSPDGRFVVASYAQSASYRAENLRPPRLLLHDVEKGSSTELDPERKSKAVSFHWRFDSKAIFFRQPHSAHDGETWAAIERLERYDIATQSRVLVDLNHDWGLDGAPIILKDGFVAPLASGALTRWKRYRALEDGSYRSEDLVGKHIAKTFVIAKAKNADRVVYMMGGASDPDHWMRARLRDNRVVKDEALYRPNGGWAKRPIAKTEILKWTGALDEGVEGILYYPHDYVVGQRYPLVLVTHGGPHSRDMDRWRENWANSANAYCQRGAFVLKVNYHGSAGYGLEFGESIRHRYYELELIDMFSGIKTLIDAGKVDADRLGLVGWSNGAILSTAAVALAHRFAPGFDFDFKVCAPGAGDVNWTSDYGNCEFGASFDDYYLEGTPWTNLEGYIAKSQLFEVERVKTPTIIFHGSKDQAVPTEQGWEWYRALHRVKKAPVRFILFPGEPHGLRKLTHQRRKLTEEFAWLDRYLFKPNAPVTRSRVKKGSPAELVLAKAKFARALRGDDLGVAFDDVLIPETITWTDKVEVTRFEISRAQWAERFGTDLKSAPGDLKSKPAASAYYARRNHPQVFVTQRAAREYLTFLRRKTGRAWRFLTAAEHTKLQSLGATDPNILKRHAGYAPNTADADALRSDLSGARRDDLLDAVDRSAHGLIRRGGQVDYIFGVQGNVAELVLDSDGRAVPLGGWVLGVKSPSGASISKIPDAWVGLRLAVGPVPAKGEG